MSNRYLQAQSIWGRLIATGILVLLIGGCGEEEVAGIDGSGSPVPPVAYVDTTIVAQGTINGFGSVILHGNHYDTAAATFYRLGEVVTEQDFEVGDVVSVSAYSEKGVLYAKEVTFEPSFNGRVEHYDAATGTITMLGQSIKLQSDTVVGAGLDDGALEGREITVTGWHDDQTTIATSIAVSNKPELSIIRGKVHRNHPGEQRAYIGALYIDYSRLEGDKSVFSDGNTLVVAGDLINPSGHELIDFKQRTGETRYLKAKRAISAALSLSDGEELTGAASVSGIVRVNPENQGFTVDDIEILVDQTTVFEDKSTDVLRHGQYVVVRGIPVGDRALDARSIKIVELGFKQGFTGEISEILSDENGFGSIVLGGQGFNIVAGTALTDTREIHSRLTFNDLQQGDYLVISAILTTQGYEALTIKRTSVGVNDRTFTSSASAFEPWGFPVGDPSNPAGDNLLYSGRLFTVPAENVLRIGDPQSPRLDIRLKMTILGDLDFTRVYTESGIEGDEQVLIDLPDVLRALLIDGHTVWVNVQGEDRGDENGGIFADKIYYEVDKPERGVVLGIPIP